MNKVFLRGRMVADPEIRETATGTKVCNFRIAVDRRVKAGEERQADFFSCTAWMQSAEFVGKYGRKGRAVIVDGRLQNREYTTNNGEKRTATDIIVDNMEFCDSRGDNGNDAEQTHAGANNTASKPMAHINEENLPF